MKENWVCTLCEVRDKPEKGPAIPRFGERVMANIAWLMILVPPLVLFGLASQVMYGDPGPVQQEDLNAALGIVWGGTLIGFGFWLVLVLLALYLLALVRIHAAIRMTAAGKVCAHCGSSEIVPTTTPKGMRISAKADAGES